MTPIDEQIKRLAAKARREEGYARDEAIRCLNALEAFKETYKKSRAKKYEFSPGPTDAAMRIEGVLLNVRMDATLTEIDKRTEEGFAGGCVLFLANSAEKRKNIEDRRKYVAATVHWALEGFGQFEPLHRLCISFDVFGGTITKAPEGFSRLRQNIEHSCREVASAWNRVPPPPGYDGPEWREAA